MLKANMQGLGGIKGLLLKHGEKIGMVVVMLAVGWFLYSSMNTKPLPSDAAAKLKSSTSRASAHIEEVKWDQFPVEEKKLASEVVISGEAMPSLALKEYAANVSLDAPILTQKAKRKDPLLLAVQDLRATGWTGLIAHVDEKVARQRMIAEAEAAERRAREEADAAASEGGDNPSGRGAVGRGATGRGAGGRGAVGRGGAGGRGMEGGRGGGLRGGRSGLGVGRSGGGRTGGGMLDGDDPNTRMIEIMIPQQGYVPQEEERIDKTYCAIIVGKIPMKDQIAKYNAALRNTFMYNPETDFPEYLAYQIERAVVAKDGSIGNWSRVAFKGFEMTEGDNPRQRRTLDKTVQEITLQRVSFDWPEQMEPIVSPKYLDPLGTFPLPPAVLHEWGKEATHPDIPLYTEESATQPEDIPQGDEAPSEDEGEELDFGGRDGLGGAARGGRGGALRGGRGGAMRGGSRGMEGMRGGRGGRGGIMGGMVNEKPADFLLFRCFDFSVVPRKKYTYRVRFILRDPNNEVPRRYLEPSVIARRDKIKSAKQRVFRIAPWSEPSNITGVPASGEILAKSIKPAARTLNSEPVATIYAKAIEQGSPEEGPFEAVHEISLKRGGVANAIADIWVISADRRSLKFKKKFLVKTGILLVDMTGGEKLKGTRNLTAPGEMLFMDSSGNLFVESAKQDKSKVAMYDLILNEESASPDAGGGRGRGEGGGMRGMEGGRGGRGARGGGRAR